MALQAVGGSQPPEAKVIGYPIFHHLVKVSSLALTPSDHREIIILIQMKASALMYDRPFFKYMSC